MGCGWLFPYIMLGVVFIFKEDGIITNGTIRFRKNFTVLFFFVTLQKIIKLIIYKLDAY